MQINFTDNKNRNIVIIVDEDNIKAYHSNHKIAEFDYNVTEYDNYKYEVSTIYELWSMNVDVSYQMSGIGTEIIRLGEEQFDNVNYPHDTGSKEGNHLSSEGGALISSCIRKGIISYEKYYGDEEEYENDYNYENE